MLNTDHLRRCLATLESSLALYRQAAPESIEQEVFRNAIVKGYELAQETAFKLIKRALRDSGHGANKLDATPVKELLRLAATHGLMSLQEVERWFAYCDNRNNTAHDYGEGFAVATLALLPGFIADAKALEATLRTRFTAEVSVATVMPRLDLPLGYLQQVQRILQAHVPEAEVWAFGSRVSGGGHEASDLDLVLRNGAAPTLENPVLPALKVAFMESDLPIRVDVLDWARIPESFRREIERAHVVLQEGAKGRE